MDDPELMFEMTEHLGDCQCACDHVVYSPSYTTCLQVGGFLSKQTIWTIVFNARLGSHSINDTTKEERSGMTEVCEIISDALFEKTQKRLQKITIGGHGDG